MTREQVAEKIRDILADDFKVAREKITDDATFRGTLGLDSLDVVDFILLLQKDFGYKAPTESYQQLDSFADLVDFVATKVSE